MRLPTINQYIDSITHPHGLFRTLRDFEVAQDPYGDVSIQSGNYAVVFRLSMHGNEYALKCYLRPNLRLRAIYDYLATLQVPYLLNASYLPDEIYVYDDYDRGYYHDAVLMPWAGDSTLDSEIRRAAFSGNKDRLIALAEAFDRLALDLLGQPWAHGDLKPDNIVITSEGQLTLLDYDSFFIPQLVGESAVQLGTPSFQHPARDHTMYDKRIDDYSIALLSVSLHALAEEPSWYADYTRDDLLILDPAEILAGTSSLYNQLLQRWSVPDHSVLLALSRILQSPSPVLPDLPNLLKTLTRQEPTVVPPHTSILHPYIHQGYYGYEDEQHRSVLVPVYDQAYEFTEGVAAVCLSGRWMFIDLRGDVMVDCGQYDNIRPFSEGLAAVCSEGRWGFIDRTGVLVIPLQFEQVLSFHEGAAPVCEQGKYGFIDTQGRWLVSPRYDRVAGFREGRACVCRDGLFGFIDRQGREIIPLTFDFATSFTDCRAQVSRDTRTWIIDPEGKLVES